MSIEEFEDTKGAIRIRISRGTDTQWPAEKNVYDKWNISVVISDTDIP